MAFGSFESGGNAQPMAEINTTPLVDVMLVLLVIFIITAPLFQQAVPIDLPQVDAKRLDEKPKTVQLGLDAEGRFYLNGSQADRATIEAHFMEVAQSNPELHLRADRNTRYEQVADILSAAQRAGIAKIAFVTDPNKK